MNMGIDSPLKENDEKENKKNFPDPY